MKAKKFPNLVVSRKRYNITQERMAKVIEKSKCAYMKKEAGVSDFYCDEMIKICNYLNARAEVEGDGCFTIDHLFCVHQVDYNQLHHN